MEAKKDHRTEGWPRKMTKEWSASSRKKHVNRVGDLEKRGQVGERRAFEINKNAQSRDFEGLCEFQESQLAPRHLAGGPPGRAP